MVIGFDVDGVLAAFVPAYQKLILKHSKLNLFQEGDDVNPPCWDWPQFRGYSESAIADVWRDIRADAHFWERLAPLQNTETLSMCVEDLQRRHDIYFITSRVGVRPKQQTEHWLRNYLGLQYPTVLISSKKGYAAAALKLDAYIDDNRDNIIDVATQSPATRAFLLDRAYNAGTLPRDVTRVGSLGQMLDYLLLNL